MKKEIKNATILEKTVRRENGKILKRVQDDMFVQDDKYGFTLAEVLITLGIIGIVAAMTMPSLIQKYQEKVTVNKLKKMYSVLSQAYTLYKIDNDVVDEFEMSPEGAVKVFQMFQKYLKIAKICGPTTKGCIYSGNYSHQNDTGYGYDTQYYYNVRLTDGSALTFRGGDEPTLFQIFYDINGELPPNKWGTDFFEFDGYEDRIMPNGSTTDISACYNSSSWACTAWVIHNENMDYLHCDDLSWDGKHKCSD